MSGGRKGRFSAMRKIVCSIIKKKKKMPMLPVARHTWKTIGRRSVGRRARARIRIKNQATRPDVAFVIRHCGDCRRYRAAYHSVAYLSALRNYCRVCIPSCLRPMYITIDARGIIMKLRDKKRVNVFKWRSRASVITLFSFQRSWKMFIIYLVFFYL